MQTSQNKYYLNPIGFVNNERALELEKTKDCIKIGSTFFTGFEVLEKKNKKGLIKKYFTVREFFNYIDKKAPIKLRENFDNLISSRDLIKKIKKSQKNNFVIFGILNVTPDSFSDGGKNLLLKDALEHSQQMVKSGADFVDLGGESTRPGAVKVSEDVEAMRILPILQLLNYNKINVSLDTRNSSTMELGILSGAKIINDVSALMNDKKSVEIIKYHQTPIILMHMPGTPQNMMKKNIYNNVLFDVYDFLEERINFCVANGIKRNNIIVDPGIGFGKNYEQNLEILRNLSLFHTLGCPIMLGVSRKRFISSIQKEDNPKNRLPGTIASTIMGMKQGIQIHRVHDVSEIVQSLKVFEKIVN